MSIAGPAQGAAEVLRIQLAGKLPVDLAKENENILASLEHGKTVDQVPAALTALYRPSIQPYLISWFKYVPATELAKLDMPVLIVQGTTDIQVAVAQAESLKHAKPAAQLAIIDGMNHVFKTVPLDPPKQIASYSDPELPLAPSLATKLVSFLKSALK